MILFHFFFLTVGLCLLGAAYEAQVDLTLEANAYGKEVVEAAIQKLEGIDGLFKNDFGFLKRIALVESNFGNSSTTAAHPNRGIWQITRKIQSRLTSGDTHAAVDNASQELGADSVSLTDPDFSTPLKAAFAARLYIDIVRGNDPMPVSLQDQADWWMNHYHPGESVDRFIQIVQRYENITSCTDKKLDLWFLLDGSGSIGSGNFQKSLEFVERTSDYFNISQDQIRAGLTIYSVETYLISNFNQHFSNDEFKVAVQASRYPKGGTSTGMAIAQVDSDGFNVSTGARPTSANVARVLIVLTDGKSHDDVVVPSDQIKSHGVLVYAVGVGNSYNETELKSIASTPTAQYVYELAKFDDLTEALSTRLQQACDFPVVLQDDSPVDMTFDPGNTGYCQTQLLAGGSVSLNFDMKTNSSTGAVYISEIVPKPSSVIFDTSFPLSGGGAGIVINDNQDGVSPVSVGRFTPKQKDKQKRSVKNNLGSRPLYIAIKATGESPLRLQLTATGSPDRVVETVPSGTGMNHVRFGGNSLLLMLAVVFWILHQ